MCVGGAIPFVLWPKFVFFIFCALISLPSRRKVDREAGVGYFGGVLLKAKPTFCFSQRANWFYSDRLNVGDSVWIQGGKKILLFIMAQGLII